MKHEFALTSSTPSIHLNNYDRQPQRNKRIYILDIKNK